jgi:threonyl-tRNA synthetase
LSSEKKINGDFMKILLIHSDYIKYKPVKKALKYVEDIEKKEVRIDDVLVAFICAEKEDEKNVPKIVEKAVDEILSKFKEVKAKNILLYPYAHLSSNLAKPYAADKILKEISKKLEERKISVYLSPFGWYKEFELKAKGHPLAEAFKEIGVEEVKEETIEEKAKRIPSRFIVLTPDGKEYDLDVKNIDKAKFLDKYPLLKSFIYSEEVKGQPSEKPPSIDIMRKLELVDYEPASEPGMFRYYPNGALIKDLLEKWISEIVIDELGAMKIDTPILYNWDEPDIRSQAIAFRERDYRIETPKKTLILRFAGDFGLFRMMKDCIFSYKQLPLRIFEISPSFRKERRSELVGLRRCSFFHMPDLHSFCKDLDQGKSEYEKIFKKYTELLNGIGIDYAIAFRVVEKHFKELKPLLLNLLKHANKPAFIELLKEAKHYWICKSEHQAIDSVGGNAQLCTVQLDVEDSERYGIMYVDRDGKKKGCIIVHSSVGSIERLIYSILETAVKAKKNPVLPLWLSPVQVRIIPLSEKYLEEAKKIMKDIESFDIRVDLDDRAESVPKKIRDAEVDWVPICLVIGPKEIKTKKLRVRFRKTGKVKEMNLKELLDTIKKELVGMPFERLTIPKLLSQRPIFVGWS